MLTQIAQVVALTNWGNSVLRRKLDIKAEKFWPEGSVFKTCKEVRFTDIAAAAAKDGPKDYAPDPLAWFKIIGEQQGQLLRLHYRPSDKPEMSDRIASGLGQGGRWFIEVVKVLASDYWEAQWEKVESRDERVWRVSYRRVSANETVRPIPFRSSLEEINSRLEKKLAEIAAFADAHKQAKFAETFRKGQKILSESKAPLEGVPHPDIMYGPHFSLKAQRALAAIQAAWVFGGKGTWNDIRLEDGKDHDTYEKLSDELYLSFCKAIVYAANSGFTKE